MLIWLEDAPVFGCDDDHDVTSFIDKIITCEKPITSEIKLKPRKLLFTASSVEVLVLVNHI